jgi:cation/acetate symporter
MTIGTSSDSALARGLGLAADTISAPVALGFAGAIFAFGYDGLVFGLGLAGGLAVLALVIAPALARLEGRSVPRFLADRFQNRAVGVLAAVIVCAAAFVLLVAQVMGAGLAMSVLTGVEPALALAIGAAVIVLVYAVLQAGRSSAVALAFLVVLAAFLAVAAALSVRSQGPMPPAPVFTTALASAQGMEESLIEQKLADPRSFKAIALPFLTFNPLNFAALLITLIAGCAVLPTALRRLSSPASGAGAQRAAVWGLTFVVLFLLLVPAIAVIAKLAVYQLVAAGTKLAELPEWVFSFGRAGLVQICGHDAIDANAVVAACGKVSGQRGVLRLQDLSIASDALVLAAPGIGGLPAAFSYTVLGGALVACGAGGAALLGVIRSIFAGESGQPVDRDAVRAWPAASSLAVVIALVAAVAAALTAPDDLVTLFCWSVSLVAAGLFPALAAALFWRRANGWAVLAAMLTGFGVALYYIVGTRYFAPQFFTTWAPLSNASSAAASRFDLLQGAAEAAQGGAAAVALDRHAQAIANWWGIKNLAAGVFGLPAGLAIIGLVSLVLPGREPPSDAQ